MECVSIDKIIKAVSGCIYEIAPKYAPRNIEVIMSKFIAKLKAHEELQTMHVTYSPFYYFQGSSKEIMHIIRDNLFDILEFRQLNLSANEYALGVDVDSDERETTYNFVSRYGNPLEDTDDDFIDLDAVIQNIDVTLFGPNRGISILLGAGEGINTVALS